MSVGYFGRKVAMSLLDTDRPIISKIEMSTDCSLLKITMIDGAVYEIKINQLEKGVLDTLKEEMDEKKKDV